MEIKPYYKLSEIGIIPMDWCVARLNEGIKLFSGHHVLAQNCNTTGEGIPYLTGPSDFPYGLIQHSKFTEKPSTICKKHDILVTVKGSGVGTIVLADSDYCISRQLMAIRTTWNTSYIYATLKHNELLFGAEATGLIPGLSRTDILEKCIPLPPTIQEQTAIATALGDADSLITSLEKLIEKKRDINQGAMQELLRPKEGWVVKKLGEIAEVRDGTHQTPQYVESGIPFYSVETITNNSFTNTKFISEVEHNFLTKTFRIEKGDILMTRIGSIGDCKLIDWVINASFYVSLALLKIKEGVSASFICHYSKSSYFKKEVELNSLQSAIPRKINLGAISNIRIVLPSNEEQTRIATNLSDMDAEIATLEQKLDKYKQIKQGMMQELLTGKTRLI